MSVSPFIPVRLPLVLVSVLKISSTNLIRTSSDAASILSLGGERGGRDRSTLRELSQRNFSPQNQFAEHLSSLVNLQVNHTWYITTKTAVPFFTSCFPLGKPLQAVPAVTNLLCDGAIIPESSLFRAVKVIVDHHNLTHRELLQQSDVMHCLSHTKSIRGMM